MCGARNYAKGKGVIRLISEYANKTCLTCGSIYVPLIVPPSFYKDLNNALLSQIWNRTDVTLRQVNHVIFCGYSFPDADVHIKYLLKRAQTNRAGELKITVINHFAGKDSEIARQEEERFKRFLGTGVNYTGESFEVFAVDPVSIIRPAGAVSARPKKTKKKKHRASKLPSW
jgi:hypothetical protein